MTEQTTSVEETKGINPEFDYKNAIEARLTQDFKDKFISNIAKPGKPPILMIKSSGLTAYSHFKGIKKESSRILQYPTQENGNTCIVESTITGYGWSPIEQKIVEVEYTAIGDASPSNCSPLVQNAFIRMAETRASSRAKRKYTNIDMLSSDEISMNQDEEQHTSASMQQKDPTEEKVLMSQLMNIKTIIMTQKVPQNDVMAILNTKFNKNDFMLLTIGEAEQVITELITRYLPKKE